MSNVHIHAPAHTLRCYRVLPKGCRKFLPDDYKTWRDAFEAGLSLSSERGFRVFVQYAFEWYDPTNTELIKVSPELAKEARLDRA